MDFAGQYEIDISELVDECRDDWVGMSAITATAASYRRDYGVQDSLKSLSIKLVSDLLDAGVEVGDLTNVGERGFVPWPLDKESTLNRISVEFDSFPDGPVTGDICWLTLD